MDEVFKALADASRRKLLDSLNKRDAQTLGELERRLPTMTRFGVMKHLRVLEDAGLVVTKKRGREGWCRVTSRCGATRPRARERRVSRGRSSSSKTPVVSRSRTISCAMTLRASFTADIR